MNEILKNAALAAGIVYLVYRICSFYIRPCMSPRHAKSQPPKDIIKQTKLPVTLTTASKT